jgi:hypothetical protein
MVSLERDRALEVLITKYKFLAAKKGNKIINNLKLEVILFLKLFYS